MRRSASTAACRPPPLAAALDAHPQARCVILTSPTYEGVVSDIASIARLCHAHGVPLLVDEAHGAHYLPFAAQYGWQGGAVAAGADLVVQSAHKTLPSLTQTAFLQLNGSLADPAEVERQLDVFETSSPSYPLLVSLDGCTGWLAQQGARPLPHGAPGWTDLTLQRKSCRTRASCAAAQTRPTRTFLRTMPASCCCRSVRRAQRICGKTALSRRWSAAPMCWR